VEVAAADVGKMRLWVRRPRRHEERDLGGQPGWAAPVELIARGHQLRRHREVVQLVDAACHGHQTVRARISFSGLGRRLARAVLLRTVKVPIDGCQTGTECRIIHAKQDQVHPIGSPTTVLRPFWWPTASKQGLNILLFMPDRTKCILFTCVEAVLVAEGQQPWQEADEVVHLGLLPVSDQLCHVQQAARFAPRHQPRPHRAHCFVVHSAGSAQQQGGDGGHNAVKRPTAQLRRDGTAGNTAESRLFCSPRQVQAEHSARLTPSRWGGGGVACRGTVRKSPFCTSSQHGVPLLIALDPVYDCHIGSEHRILHAQQDRLCPNGFSDVHHGCAPRREPLFFHCLYKVSHNLFIQGLNPKPYLSKAQVPHRLFVQTQISAPCISRRLMGRSAEATPLTKRRPSHAHLSSRASVFPEISHCLSRYS
jgi:hypothetical protein